MRAASTVPSFNGINACSITRTVLGKVLTITATLQSGTLRTTGAPSETHLDLGGREVGGGPWKRPFFAKGARATTATSTVFGRSRTAGAPPDIPAFAASPLLTR